MTTAAIPADRAIDAAVIVSSGPARTIQPTPGARHPGLVEDSFVKLNSRTKYIYVSQVMYMYHMSQVV